MSTLFSADVARLVYMSKSSQVDDQRKVWHDIQPYQSDGFTCVMGRERADDCASLVILKSIVMSP